MMKVVVGRQRAWGSWVCLREGENACKTSIFQHVAQAAMEDFVVFFSAASFLLDICYSTH